MTATEAAAPSAWTWWEKRRLTYNAALFIAGWLGFVILWVIAYGGDIRPVMHWFFDLSDFLIVVTRMGLVYLVYMAAANVLFLLGPLCEAVLKPESTSDYRRRAWLMGLLLSLGFPLVIAVIFGLAIWDPGHGG